MEKQLISSDKFKIYKKIHKPIDKKKKTILFTIGFAKLYRQLNIISEHHEDFTDCVLPFLKDDYNIIIVTTGKTPYQNNLFKDFCNACMFMTVSELILKNELTENCLDEIFNKIRESVLEFNISKAVDFSCRITYAFENYTDFKMDNIEKIKGGVRMRRDSKNIQEFIDKWDSHQSQFRFGGYITMTPNILRAVMHTLNIKLGIESYIFSPDPRYNKVCKETVFAFAEDDVYYPKMNEFKVDVIKHGYVTPMFLNKGLFNSRIPLFKNKKANLLFFGTVSSERNDSRILMYKDYLMNLEGDNHSLYYKKIKGDTEKFTDIYEHLLNNKFHKGYEASYDECTNELLNHRYSFVPPPIIKNSYHRRIAHAVALNNLPIVSYDYDTLNKQLPAKFNNILRVNNSSEINQKIKYFNQNPEEAQEIIDEIKQYMGFNDLKTKGQIKKYIIDKLDL